MSTENNFGQSALPADWADFYTKLQGKAKVPDASVSIIGENKAAFRGMVQNLKQIQTAIHNSAFEPLMTVVYADVLIIPKGTQWLAESSALAIYARRIEVESGAGILLDYTQSENAQLLFFANEMSGSIAVSAIKNLKDAPVEFVLNEGNIRPGISVSNDDGNIILQKLLMDQGREFQLSEDMNLYLNNAFIFGSILYDQNPALALSIFLWVKAWAALYEELEELFYRSTTLVNLLNAQVNAAANGAAFVPYLTKSVYTSLSAAFVAEATRYENDYMQLYVCKTLTEQNISAAQTMADTAESEKNYVEALLQQATSNYHNAVATCNKANLNFIHQQITADGLAAKFQQIGIPDYEREQIIKAVVGLVTAVVKFAGAIGGMAAGNAAGAPAAAESTIGGVNAVAKAADTAADVAKTATVLGVSMKELKKLVEGLQKVYELAKSVMEVVSDIGAAKGQMKVIQKLDDYAKGVDLSAADSWAVYKILAGNVLEDPVKLKIGFAKEYKEALDILVVYGQALSAAQLAVIKSGQHVAAITFQLHYVQQKQQQLKDLVSKLKQGEKPVLSMMQQFYQKYIDKKSSLFAALKSYQASYFYWALKPSVVRPQIVDSIGDLNAGLDQLTRIAMDTTTALEQFDPPPQHFEHMVFEITDKEVLKELRESAKASWVLPLDNADFEGLSRTRLRTIRIWLEGTAFEGTHDLVSMTINTSGNYLDRFKNHNYQFNSRPLTRAFQYQVKATGLHPQWIFEDGRQGFIRMDGTVDKEVAYAYFEPTPFSEWSISVDVTKHKVDLSKVSKIVMYFEGTAIGTATAITNFKAKKMQSYAAAGE